jgi:hypothetical protein
MPRPVAILLLVGVLCVLGLTVALPTDRLELGPGCTPISQLSEVRASLFGPLFWHKQRLALQAEIQREIEIAKFLGQTRAEADSTLAKVQQILPTPSEADLLRAKADALDDQQVQRVIAEATAARLNFLYQCGEHVRRTHPEQ